MIAKKAMPRIRLPVLSHIVHHHSSSGAVFLSPELLFQFFEQSAFYGACILTADSGDDSLFAGRLVNYTHTNVTVPVDPVLVALPI